MATPAPPRSPCLNAPYQRWRPVVLPLVVLLGLGLAAGVVSRAWRTDSRAGPEHDTFPVTPLSDSPYLNTRPDARYVGSAACEGCHAERHESFRHTGMGRSMAEVDLTREPADGSFVHEKSKRRYEVARKNGELWHREFLAAGAPAVILAEYAQKYVVGSGRHSLSYLCEADGFLVESPVTWYTSRRAWDLSPGYNVPEPPGFDRAVGEGCLHCHAGRALATDGSLHRMKVIEAAIGCERCHGPGSLHVERHRGPPTKGSALRDTDFTIVNPARLPRDLAESVCQQCHLRTTAVIPARGRSFADFRPGLPLQDVVHAFQLESENSAMTVVGHVEQMHLSRCYQRSDKLTCLTCHSPHSEPRPEDRIEHYRRACLTCHEPQHCKVTAERRKTESPENDCAHCHMPRSPTEIPHLAFTHHRIGLHDAKPRPAAGVEQLVPFADLSRFTPVDRDRSLGLGYLEAANRAKDPRQVRTQRDRALELLSGVQKAGLPDPVVSAALARIRFEEGGRGVLELADAALADASLPAQDRCNVLLMRADELAAQRRHTETVAALHELTRLRRHPSDWLLLADCERALGHEREWAASLEAAAGINPRLWRVHQALAEHYRRAGNVEKERWHSERSRP